MQYKLMFSYFMVVLILLFLNESESEAATSSDQNLAGGSKQIIHRIGAILDLSSRIGKEEKIAMELAKDDFHNYTTAKNRLHLLVRDSHNSLLQAAFDAMDLINEQHVKAILGFRDQTTIVAELGEKSQVPVLSLSEDVSHWASRKWNFLVPTVGNQYSQMRAVAAIIGSWKWSNVNIIYEEDLSSGATNFIPRLVEALREVECNIEYLLPLPSVKIALFPPLFSKELAKLKRGKSKVFIVHSSLDVASHLLKEAKSMAMMEKDSVWITTGALTNVLSYVNESAISSMQGMLGVKRYFPENGARFKDFYSRFRTRFHLEFPAEINTEPGSFSLQAYDALWATALAMDTRVTSKKIIGNLPNNLTLLERIRASSFMGLTGEFRLKEGHRLGGKHIYQIVNVYGSSYKELGFWYEGLGFCKSMSACDQEGLLYNVSMKNLWPVIWPGGSLSVPRGLMLPMSALRIGVPAKPTFHEFVNVRYDHRGGKPLVDGLSIDVFKAVIANLPYQLQYDFIPYHGTYDSLVKQIHLKVEKTFDGVIGDTSIVASRCEYADFSQPWTDPGLQMVVFQKSMKSKKSWLFAMPFTKTMWGVTAGINIYNGFVVWLIERMHNPEFRGSTWNQIGILTWLSFTTLFSLHGDGLHSNLSRITMVAWLFVAIVITQSYTANLSSLLTVPRLEASLVSVESLKKTSAKVGCDGGSFVIKYLVDVLGFHSDNIQTVHSADDYPQALKSGEIKAAFLAVPFVKVLLAKNCRDFAVVGPTYRVGGFGFAFPKGSPILPDISKALLEVAESGTLLKLQNSLLSSYNCSSSYGFDDDHDRLDVTSYWGLFAITGVISTISLVLFIIRSVSERRSLDSFIDKTIENQNHDPNLDERWMFAPEMDGPNYGRAGG